MTKMTNTEMIKMSGLTAASLLCQESDEANLEEDGLNEDCLFTGNVDYVEMLFERETGIGFGKGASFECGNWIKGVRLEAITWILQTRERFGFRFSTAYLSITYFDAFICRRAIDSEKHWAIRLLSVACLSLAAKMEECNIPVLPEFRQEHYLFKSEDIRRMELLVLQTLEWKMRFVTPYTFLQFFISVFCEESPPQDIITRINTLVFAMVKEINIMKQRPSAIAAAATLAASYPSLTIRSVELKLKSISSENSLKVPQEELFTSYTMMLKVNMEKIELFDSPNPIKCDALDGSSATSDISSEGERIVFDDHDQIRERKQEQNNKDEGAPITDKFKHGMVPDEHTESMRLEVKIEALVGIEEKDPIIEQERSTGSCSFNT